MNKKTVALTLDQYREIIQTMREGFTGAKPNPRIAAALMLEANLGLRISDILRLRVSDISKTSVCPLARAVRQALKKKGITHLKAVWSDEPPRMPAPLPDGEPLPPGKRSLPGSIMFVPAAAGLLIAAEVIQDLTREGV